MPIIASEAVVKPSDISSATAMILFFQTIGGAFFVSAAQSAFTNRLTDTLATNTLSINAAQVIITGVGELRSVFPSDVIPGLLRSYLSGIHASFIIAILAAAIATAVSFFSDWRTIKVVM